MISFFRPVVSRLLAALLGLGGGGWVAASSLHAADATAAEAAAGLPKLGAAPAWKLKNLEGKEVSSDQFKDKVVVVDFWATWCAPCVSEIPGYIELQKKYGKDGFVMVGISLDQVAAAKVKSFVEKHGMNYVVALDPTFDVAGSFGGTDVLPTTLLIDRTGQIRDRKVGTADPVEYEKKVASLLK